MGNGSGLDGALLLDLTGRVITVAGDPATDFFIIQASRFNSIRTRFVKTGGTFALDFRWLNAQDAASFLAEDTGIADGSDTQVDGPYLQVRLLASVTDVTITRGSIYGAGSPSA